MSASQYPYQPGYKDQDTSKKAALGIRGDKLKAGHQVVLDLLAKHPYGLTAEEIIDSSWVGKISDYSDAMAYAKAYRRHDDYIRPRVAELGKMQEPKIKDSGIRRSTEGGSTVAVWVIATPTPPIYSFNQQGQGVFL